MPRRNGRFVAILVAVVSLAALWPNAAGARSAGVEANTLTAVCTAVLDARTTSYSPGKSGIFTATVTAPCVGTGFAYDRIQLSVTRRDLVTGAFKSFVSKGCERGPTCSLHFAFKGGPDQFTTFASVWWTSTAGPWLFATPGVLISSAPFCYGVYTGEWPVTPVGPASQTVGCNLLADTVA